jgi:hypothetical protein
MREITVPSSAVALRADKPLTPAMTSVVWELASALDASRTPANVPNAVWLELPSAQLRGEGARADNVWLRECLDRLTGIKISGEWRGDPWGAVLVAQWELKEGGSMVRVLIPPAGVHALRSPQNFAKIEARAAHSLTGHGRQLYLLLADKKRLGRPSWSFTVDELRALMGVNGKGSYDRWNNFRARVLDPAVQQVNDYGTVDVKMDLEKRGRSIHGVTFRWKWKDPHDAADLDVENERHSAARRKIQQGTDAPPLTGTDAPQADPAAEWWGELDDATRAKWADGIGRTFRAGGSVMPRREADIRARAFAQFNEGLTPETAYPVE